MSKGVNKVILIGNCGQDPEIKQFSDGGSVTNVTIATSESWKDKKTGQMQEKTEWHKATFRDRGNFLMGQHAAQWLKKGSKVYIEGSLKTRTWEQDGVKRYATEIVVNEFQTLDSKPESQFGKPNNTDKNTESFVDDDLPF